MKKLVLSLALAGLLADGALAENEGFFVGALLGTNSISSDVESNVNGTITSGSGSSYQGFKSGIFAGLLQNFGENFSARYYGQLEAGSYTTSFNANADALYSFYKNKEFGLELRGFGGLYAGYTGYHGSIDSASGFDLGLNLGLRVVIKERHGIEPFAKIGFLEQEGDTQYSYLNYYNASYTTKYRQTYIIGLRYTFTF